MYKKIIIFVFLISTTAYVEADDCSISKFISDYLTRINNYIADEDYENAKKELDKIIKSDTSHTFNNAKDALKGAVEGKLPVQLKDGKFMPLELTVTLKFDPNTQKIEVLNRG